CTATTMSSLAEALGMSRPGCAAIPAPYRERGQIAFETGRRIVEMVREDLKPSDILTREAFLNAIVVNSAIGGSTNAPIHLNALARHIGVPLSVEDWETHGRAVPLLVNLQPAGEYLGEDYYHAGGVPAVVHSLMAHGLIHEAALTANGRTIGENCRDTPVRDERVIWPFEAPLKPEAGFGPIGYPGSAEVVNMRAPAYLLARGVTALPCMGDGRQSGTSGSPSILNASPEAAAGGGLALVRTGDRIRIDLRARRVDMLVP